MANEAGFVGGIDSHKDTIHVAVITDLGVEVVDREFCTTQDAYRTAVAWLAGRGRLTAVGIEGTSGCGASISAALTEAGVKVMEVNRTRPAERRKQGKSDRLDAYRAARAVLAGEASAETKRASIEPLREAGRTCHPDARRSGAGGRPAPPTGGRPVPALVAISHYARQASIFGAASGNDRGRADRHLGAPMVTPA